jgi:hypothetical protein
VVLWGSGSLQKPPPSALHHNTQLTSLFMGKG